MRRVARIAVVARPAQALSQKEWNAVRRAAITLQPRDHGLAVSLVCLMRFAGPRVGDIAALRLPDVRLTTSIYVDLARDVMDKELQANAL